MQPIRRWIATALQVPILLQNQVKVKSRTIDGSLEAFKEMLLSSKPTRNGELFRIYNKIYDDGNIKILSHEHHTQMLTLMVMHKNFEMASNYVGNIIENMINSNYKMDIKDHYLCLAVYLKARKYHFVIDHFDSIKPIYHLKPSTACYNLKMAAFCYLNDLDGLVATWKEFVTEYPYLRHINQEGYAFLIEGLGRAGRIDEAVQHYQQISSKFPPSKSNDIPKIPLSNAVHIAMIRAYGYAGNSELAITVFNEFLLNQQEMSQELIYSYDAIIQSLFDSNSPEKALGFYSRISEICRAYNESILGQDDLNNASPGIDTLERVIGYYYSLLDSLNIVQVYKSNWHVSSLNTESKETVVRALLDQGLLEEAEDLFEEMVSFYQAPSEELQIKFGYDPESGFNKRI
jgi:pentatricopeptide repeat protein